MSVLSVLSVVLPVVGVVVVIVGVWADRRWCASLPGAVPVYGLRSASGCLLYPGITVQRVEARWAQHQDPDRMSRRGRDFKTVVAIERSTILRLARNEAQARRIERRYILALAWGFRWGVVLGAPYRYLGNVQHNRRPKGRLEAVAIAAWALGYEVMGWLCRGEYVSVATVEGREVVSVIPIDGRWVWPWSP